MFGGTHGIRSGIVGHGGAGAELFPEGARRGFAGRLGESSWMSALSAAGMHTATISSFATRHGAWHWLPGFQEVRDPGGRGMDLGEGVAALALDWLDRNGRGSDWFLHVNLWDPHTPYRAPASLGEPFAHDPLPEWLDEDVLRRSQTTCGPHTALELHGFGDEADPTPDFPRSSAQLRTLDDVKHWVDGYDAGILYADIQVGRILDRLDALGVLGDTAVVVGADHGESQGELGIWGDHQLADTSTCQTPLIVRWPGLQAGIDGGLHYQFDWAATTIELLGGALPQDWDGVSFAGPLRAGAATGRDHLVLSQGAWTCQRSVRFSDLLLIRTLHDGYHDFPDVMLFDVREDPHLQANLAPARDDDVERGLRLLAAWQREMSAKGAESDPMISVLREGGPMHTRGRLPAYLARLRATGRAHLADALAQRHPNEAAGTAGPPPKPL